MLRNSKDTYLTSSNFQKRPREDSRKYSKRLSLNTRGQSKIDRSAKDYPNDCIYILLNKISIYNIQIKIYILLTMH